MERYVCTDNGKFIKRDYIISVFVDENEGLNSHMYKYAVYGVVAELGTVLLWAYKTESEAEACLAAFVNVEIGNLSRRI